MADNHDPKESAESDTNSSPADNDEAILSRRKEVTRLFLKGKTVEEIAVTVGASTATVKRDITALGLRRIKRQQVDQRWLKKAVAEAIEEIDAEEAMRERGIKRDPVSNRLYFETVIQFPKGSKHLRPEGYSLIPVPESAKRSIEIVSFDPVECRYVQRHYIDG